MKRSNPVPRTVDEYIQAIEDEKSRSLLERVRNIIRSTAPKAVEGISYHMPSYKLDGILMYFAAFTHHCSLFPASKKVVSDFKDELSSFKTSKGTIQFTADHPLPDALLRKIVKARVKENAEKMAMKKSAKAAKPKV